MAAVGASWLAAGLTFGAVLWPAVPAAAATPLPVDAPGPYTLSWTAAHPASAPPALQHPVAAYDGDNSDVVLFGGVTPGGSVSNDTWVWDGRTWVEHPASSMTQAPPGRQGASMAFDPVLHQLILFGGQGQNGAFLGDTWAWNGASWYQLTPGPSGSPGARSDSSMALGPDGSLVLFGGMGPAATNGAATTAAPATTTPASKSTAAPAAGPADTQVLGDTWQWTAKGWTPVSTPGPSPRWGAAMAYDSTGHMTVLFSGDGSTPGAGAQPVPGTWTWDGSHWSSQGTAGAPPARFGAVMGDDPAAGGAVLVAGSGQSGALGDGWLWNGSGWAAVQTSGEAPRQAAAGAYDSATSSLVVFGGSSVDGKPLVDTELVSTIVAQSGTPPSPPTTVVGTPGTAPQPPASTPAPAPSGTKDVTTSPTTPPPPEKHPSTTPTTKVGTHPTGAPPGSVSLLPATAAPMTLQTSEHNVRQGAEVRLAGSGFAPGTPVTITFHSNPALVARSVAGPLGDFAVTVAVPRTAKPGLHHFVASGVTLSGKPGTLVASVYVLGKPGRGTPLAVKAGMVGLALLIPAGAWLSMTGAGWWRRRSRRGGPAAG